ncbi:aspartyl protease family protein [Pandoraea sputorum]|uniref:aspartyl protease family protein n=1 Tax=Pandoraea sputorum TaxID=93222 RepID=UPI001CD62E7A
MAQAGIAIPKPSPGAFLIDTGASSTCIDPSVLEPLGLTPTGQTEVHTPSTNGTPHVCNLYDVQLLVPGQTGIEAPFIIPAMPVTESHLASQGITGLIGRDVLSKCVLVYNGAANFYSLSY